jgi:peptidoglycan/xylan/chitin deacetylase (PgdA/CDA1 family)
MLAILNYHNIAIAPSGMRMRRLYVSPLQFDRHLWWLRRLGLVGVTLSEGIRRLRARNAARCVALTFDDGYADNVVNAAPILAQYGFSATCFVVSERIGSHNTWDANLLGGRKPLMNEAQLKTWVDAGFEVGSHTCTHPDLTTLPRDAVTEELVSSRQALQRLIGVPIVTFCYPFGRLNSDLVGCVKRAGYELAVTTRRGRAAPGDDALALPRLSVSGDKSVANVLLKAATPYGDLHRLRSGALRSGA